MQIEFLGSGGASTIPKPGCTCRVCVEAREKGVPYSRTGPSLFIHGPDILIDTPEEIKYQLNRAAIQRITGCFYSHWHPDHVLGLRVWEKNLDIRHWPPQNMQTDIYLPQQVAQDFREKLGLWQHLTYFTNVLKVTRLIELSDGDSVTLGDVDIYPFRLAEDYVYAFLLNSEGKRVLIAPDELVGWDPPTEVQGVDLAILPMGIVEIDPLTGQRLIPAAHPVLKTEATFRQTLDIIRQLKASRVILSHIEELWGLTHDDYQRVAEQLQNDGLDITFAYDTMRVDV